MPMRQNFGHMIYNQAFERSGAARPHFKCKTGVECDSLNLDTDSLIGRKRALIQVQSLQNIRIEQKIEDRKCSSLHCLFRIRHTQSFNSRQSALCLQMVWQIGGGVRKKEIKEKLLSIQSSHVMFLCVSCSFVCLWPGLTLSSIYLVSSHQFPTAHEESHLSRHTKTKQTKNPSRYHSLTLTLLSFANTMSVFSFFSVKCGNFTADRFSRKKNARVFGHRKMFMRAQLFGSLIGRADRGIHISFSYFFSYRVAGAV